MNRLPTLLMLVFVLLLQCAGAPGSAQENAPDLDSMSIDDLLSLRSEIDAALIEKGSAEYAALERGDKGDAVIKLQERLSELGYYSGRFSGKLDSETQKALKQFEKANGLENDGLASVGDQVILYSAFAVGRTTAASPEPVEAGGTETDANKAEYGEFVYEDYFRNPENYTGDKVVLTGKVVQVLGDRSSGFQIRLATSGGSDIVYVYIYFDPGYNILVDDRLAVYAVMQGTLTYESIFGQEITVPKAKAEIIELQ